MGTRLEELQRKTQVATAVAVQEQKPTPFKTPYRKTAEHQSVVEALAFMGVSRKTIGEYLGVSDYVIKNHYDSVIKHARTGMNVNVVRSLYQRGLRGDTAALIFWAKTQLGWKETQVREYVLPEISLVAVDGSVVRTTKSDQPPTLDAEFEELPDDDENS